MKVRVALLVVPVALVGLVGLATWQRWHVLGATPFPVGVDGYFYPIEVRSILEHGALRYPASPVTFLWMTPFALVAGPIVGAKIGAALGGALIAIPAYGVGLQLAKSRAAALVAAVIASLSASSCFLAFEFVKQGIGLTVGLAALWFVLRAIEVPANAETRQRVVAAVVALAIAFLTHKLAAVIVVAITLPEVIVTVRRRLHGRRLIYAALAGLVAASIVLALGVIVPTRFVSPHELSLVAHMFTTQLRWDLPTLVGNQTLAFDHEPLLAGVLALVAAFLVKRPRDHQLTIWMIVAIAIFIAMPFLDVTDPQGLTFRLRLTAFVPLALLAAVCVAELGHERWFYGLAAVLAAYGLVRDHGDGVVLTHPALAAAVEAANGKIPDGATVIVPERHILFMVDWYTHADVALRPESIAYEHRMRLFGLVFVGGPDSPLDRALDAARTHPTLHVTGLHAGHRNGLVLVDEPTWHWLLAQLPPNDQAHFAAWPTI